jgi:transcriptional regulator of acetoin/glycerol metabolism
VPAALDAEIRTRMAAFAGELAGLVKLATLEAVYDALQGEVTSDQDAATSGPVAVPVHRNRVAPHNGHVAGTEPGADAAPTIDSSPPLSLAAYERSAILRALAETGGNVLAAARLMGESRSALYRHIRALGIPRGVPEPSSYLVLDGPPSLAAYERAALERAMAEAGGDIQAAAKLLGVGKSTMYRKVERYGIG